MPKDYAAAMSSSSLSPSSSTPTLNGVPGEGTGCGYHSSSTKMISSLSSISIAGPSSVAISNAHCSLGQTGGSSGSGMGPIMEIREMTGYGNALNVPPDKYWNPQHGTCTMVSGSTSVSVRHSAVYPPVFYTPPPPQSYPTCGSVPAGPSSVSATAPEWNCAPLPPPHTESYSHFLYSQYPSHNDYGNFLGIPPSSCYETDLLMMGSVPTVPGQGTGIGMTAQVSESSICEQAQPLSLQPPPAPLVYPPPQPQPVYDTKNSSLEKVPDPVVDPSTRLSAASPTDTSSSEDLDDDPEDDDDDDDDRHIILIEDDENGHSPFFSLCSLCRKPALVSSSSPQNSLSSHQPPPSPQLSKILGDIDDNELDISVCSGDIEIGGIEDEMMQQDAEALQGHHAPFKISLESLAQLVGVPISSLLPDNGEQQCEETPAETVDAVLCLKCQKMVELAESLEKQLNSVLISLRQIVKHHDSVQPPRKQSTSTPEEVKLLSTVSTQTGDTEADVDYNLDNNTQIGKYRCILLLQGNTKSPFGDSSLPQLESQVTPENSQPKKFLCHECGRTFNCGRNLGKHLRRTHWNSLGPTSTPRRMIPCTRESCTKKCSDNTKLKSHIKSHSDDKRHFCGHCFKLFSSKSNLTAHLKLESCIVETPPNTSLNYLHSTPFNTDRPHPKSNRKSNLLEPPFRCENCGLTFRTELRFRQHSKGPSSSCLPSKLFRCEECTKLFAKRSELRVHHQSVHFGKRPFPCDICGLTFSTKGNQRVHQRTHGLEKRFKCGQCGKGFTRNQTLQVHLSNLHKS